MKVYTVINGIQSPKANQIEILDNLKNSVTDDDEEILVGLSPLSVIASIISMMEILSNENPVSERIVIAASVYSIEVDPTDLEIVSDEDDPYYINMEHYGAMILSLKNI